MYKVNMLDTDDKSMLCIGPFEKRESAEKAAFLLLNCIKVYTESFRKPREIRVVED